MVSEASWPRAADSVSAARLSFASNRAGDRNAFVHRRARIAGSELAGGLAPHLGAPRPAEREHASGSALFVEVSGTEGGVVLVQCLRCSPIVTSPERVVDLPHETEL